MLITSYCLHTIKCVIHGVTKFHFLATLRHTPNLLNEINFSLIEIYSSDK